MDFNCDLVCAEDPLYFKTVDLKFIEVSVDYGLIVLLEKYLNTANNKINL